MTYELNHTITSPFGQEILIPDQYVGKIFKRQDNAGNLTFEIGEKTVGHWSRLHGSNWYSNNAYEIIWGERGFPSDFPKALSSTPLEEKNIQTWKDGKKFIQDGFVFRKDNSGWYAADSTPKIAIVQIQSI